MMTNFITIDANGLHRASFVEIQEALITEFKNIYGSDIDVSTASADGVYIHTLALMINNILRAVKDLYWQLDVNSAAGVNLDSLCALSNVFRRQATNSIASITVTNNGPTTYSEDRPIFIDKASVMWQYMDGELTVEPGETKSIFVTCTDIGPITAEPGWIYSTLNSTTLDVSQTKSAIIGSEKESDISLRMRRANSSKLPSNTILEAIQEALLSIDGIEDVFIYNNNSDNQIQANDTTYIDCHSIYVILRKNPNITVPDETIGQLIHAKITPGIKTTLANGVMGSPKAYTYSEKLYNTYIADSQQDVYWKQAFPYAPQITITFTANQYFSHPTVVDGVTYDNEVKVIAEAIQKYMNDLPIRETATDTSITNQMFMIDPKYNGMRTYDNISASITTAIKPDTYYFYDHYSYSNSGNIYTLTIDSTI